MGKDKYKLAIGLLLLATVLWSVSGAVLKILFARTDLTASAMAGYRAAFAGLALLPFALRSGGLRISRLQPIGWAVVAALAFCLMGLSFVSSVGQTTSANAIILMYTAPLWVLMLAPSLTGDRAQRRDLWAAVIGMAGMVVIVFGPSVYGHRQSGTEVTGMVMGLASGICFAAVSLALRQLKRANPFAVTCVNNLVTAGGLLVVAMLQGSLSLPWWAGGALAGLGALQIAAPYAIFCYALRHVTPQRATLLSLAEPILNPIWVWLVVGESPAAATLIGGGIVLTGLVVMVCGSAPAERTTTTTATTTATTWPRINTDSRG